MNIQDSVVASAPQPYTSAYVASKYAVRGFSASLRMELALEKGHDIEVCTILPASLDTPLYSHTVNCLGRKVKAMSPVNRPEGVARAIANEMERRKPFVDRGDFSDEPAPRSEGSLFEPDTANKNDSGGWKKTRP